MANNMAYKNIKGAEQLVKELHAPLESINADIAELEKKRDELEAQLDKSENRFKLDVVKKNKSIQSELDLINRILNEAKVERERIIKDSMDKAYEKAEKIIREYKKEIYHSKKAENAAMIKKIYEIREIFKGLVEEEERVSEEISQFINDISTFIEDEPGIGGTQSKLSQLMQQADTHTYGFSALKLFDVFKESDYGIKGLLKKEYHTSQSEEESNRKYGVEQEVKQ